MKKLQKSRPTVTIQLEQGQLWRYPGFDIRVVHVGRYLVEHKITKAGGGNTRSRSVFASITELGENLAAKKAKLVVNEAPAETPA